VFLAALMWLDPQGWYALGLHAQAVLGALTATITVLLARHWLSNAWAFVAGALVAVWPHHVAATGAPLTAVVFGFLLMLALWLSAEAMKPRSVGWAAGAGVAFSAAALTSMISLLFPVFVGLAMWRGKLPRAALLVVALSLLGPAAWSVRNATVDHPQGQPGRMTMNLVQGSWPQYHAAFRSQNSSPVGKSILRAIDEEVQLLASTPRSGLRHMGARMARDPAYYLRWYVLEKPYLLWDWDIRVGAGDIYVLDVRHSPFTTQLVLRTIR